MKQTIVCDAGTASSDGKMLTFLANSGTRMTNGYTVDLQSLQAPVNGGLLKPVTELADSDKLTLPLLLDHMPSITAQAGIIEKLWITDEGLMARARLSSNGLGEDVRQLASEGMLTNSFSITIDFDNEPDENGVIRDAELVEISVVYRGADSKAVFRSLNNREGKTMKIKNNLTKDEAQALIDELTDAIHDLTEKTDDDMPPEEPAQSNEAENSKEGDATVSNGRTNIIINSAGAARQSLAKTSDPLDEWLKSEDATKAYEQALWKADNQGVNGFKAAWREELARHAYVNNSSIDADSVTKLVPTSVITEIEDALNKASELWPLYRKLDVDSFTVGAQLAGLTDDTRAHGYKVADYGTSKKTQKFNLVERKLAADFVVKYAVLNKGDIRRTDKPGALVKYLLSEMPNYILHAIDRQIILGGYTDMDFFRSVQTDAKDSSSDFAGKNFALSATEGDRANLVLDVVGLASKITATGTKVLVMSPETKVDVITAADGIGRPLVGYGNDSLAAYLGVDKVITPDWWTDTDDAKTRAVVIVPEAYGVVGDTSISAFTNFALKTNEQEYLSEIFAGGALTKVKSAGVLNPKTA
jgi:hypothetical protein|nr:MAG TPA_asm: major capsid protein [Caudoviricetes sp.]